MQPRAILHHCQTAETRQVSVSTETSCRYSSFFFPAWLVRVPGFGTSLGTLNSSSTRRFTQTTSFSLFYNCFHSFVTDFVNHNSSTGPRQSIKPKTKRPEKRRAHSPLRMCQSTHVHTCSTPGTPQAHTRSVHMHRQNSRQVVTQIVVAC